MTHPFASTDLSPPGPFLIGAAVVVLRYVFTTAPLSPTAVGIKLGLRGCELFFSLVCNLHVDPVALAKVHGLAHLFWVRPLMACRGSHTQYVLARQWAAACFGSFGENAFVSIGTFIGVYPVDRLHG
jgi:hypothetical protein